MLCDLNMENIPGHVGIILDGNRRFAKKLMKEPWKGHEYGADKVEKLKRFTDAHGFKTDIDVCGQKISIIIHLKGKDKLRQ